MNKTTTYVLLICMVSTMGGLLFGYDWVVVGGAKIFYEPFFELEGSAALRGWAMSSALIGCLFGAVLSGKWSDLYGRKKMLVIAASLFTLSAVGTGITSNFIRFIFYRIIGGLGIGIASNISPIYIAEVSPAAVRGKLVSLNQLAIVLGILLAQIVNWRIGRAYSAGTDQLNAAGIQWAWRWMFLAETIPAVTFFILSFIIPESPRWLAVHGKTDSARNILTRIGGESYAARILDTTKEAVPHRDHAVGWRDLCGPKLRKVLGAGIFLAVFQQWCGINVIFNYAHEIFSAAGYAVSDVLMNIVVTGVTNVIFTIAAIYTVDKLGRRTLMLTGSIGLTFIYLILGACYHMRLSGFPMLVLVVTAIACYAMSLAPVVWVVLSEIFPTRVRGAAMAIATFFLWTACFVLTYTFPILNKKVGAAGTFWIYGAICLVGAFFIYLRLPETKGKTLEEIEQEMTG